MLHRYILMIFALSFVSLAAGPASLLAQERNDAQSTANFGGRYAGDFGVTVNGYLWVPLFNIDPTAAITRSTNLALGGGVDLAVAYYLSPGLSLGGFLNLGLSSPANQTNLQSYMVAVTLGPRLGYDFNIYTLKNQTYPFITIPIGLGLAASIVKFGDITNVMPLLKADAGIYISPLRNPEWSFGLTLHYSMFFDFTRKELSRIGNYLYIGIGFTYHTGL